MDARYAIYFVPESGTKLAVLGSSLLGRDSETGAPVEQPRIPGLTPSRFRELTTDVRRYGLHATLKAPFYLKRGKTEQGLLEAASHFVSGRQAITLPRLMLRRMDSFFALVPAAETPLEQRALSAIAGLAADAVSFFDPFRAAPSAHELARRNPEKLTARQRQLLAEWGYPYVFDAYRFHITLTDRISSPEETRQALPALEAFLKPALMEETAVSGICVCKQDVGGTGPFSLLKRIPAGSGDGK